VLQSDLAVSLSEDGVSISRILGMVLFQCKWTGDNGRRCGYGTVDRVSGWWRVCGASHGTVLVPTFGWRTRSEFWPVGFTYQSDAREGGTWMPRASERETGVRGEVFFPENWKDCMTGNVARDEYSSVPTRHWSCPVPEGIYTRRRSRWSVLLFCFGPLDLSSLGLSCGS